MRLIDADKLEDTWDQGKTMIDNVEAQPTVSPVKHGHWIVRYEYDTYCSYCAQEVPYVMDIEDILQYIKYCPWCGAKMDEVTE